MYEDDFYYEPSEFEMQLDDFKQSLMQSVKNEFKSELERLRKENAELRDFKQQKRNIEREIETLKRKAEQDKEEAFRQAKRARLSELMGGFEVEMWTPEYYYMESRKCNLCDDKRQIHYRTPLGRNAVETCTCAGRIAVYHPAKNILHKISTRRDWGTIKNAWLYYSLASDGDYDSAENRSSDAAKNLFVQGVTTFEEVESNHYRRFYFENFEDCHRFCTWKMEKDAGFLKE